MPEKAESRARIASPVREGRRRRPGCPPARGTRTLRRCSFEARSKGQPWPLLLGEVWEIEDSWEDTHVGPVLAERAP
jgi:hypothetical protein